MAQMAVHPATQKFLGFFVPVHEFVAINLATITHILFKPAGKNFCAVMPIFACLGQSFKTLGSAY